LTVSCAAAGRISAELPAAETTAADFKSSRLEMPLMTRAPHWTMERHTGTARAPDHRKRDAIDSLGVQAE
jgi:hypothetical protein